MRFFGSLGITILGALLVTFVLLSISFVMQKYSGLIKSPKLKNTIEIFYILVTVLTAFSIIFGVITFYTDRYNKEKIDNELNKKIAENTAKEIDYNLGLIKHIRDNEDKFRNTQEFTTSRFNVYYLEKMQDIIKDPQVRFLDMDLVHHLKQSNTNMDLFSGKLFLELNDEQLLIYKKLKNEQINGLMNDFIAIESGLKLLNANIK